MRLFIDRNGINEGYVMAVSNVRLLIVWEDTDMLIKRKDNRIAEYDASSKEMSHAG